MDKALEKFGVYDFFGIWVPGALTVTYYLFTLRTFFSSLFNYLGINQNGLSGDFLLIILYTAISYIAGVILHEIGKILADCCKFFRLSDINDRVLKKDIVKRPHCILKKIRYDYQQAFKQNDISNAYIVEFDKAISVLKFDKNINTKRIDTYHAIYALSRSLCLCFIVNLLLLLVNWVVFKDTPHCLLIVIDICFSVLFFIRTYRYFHSWVKNVYLQYYREISIKNINSNIHLQRCNMCFICDRIEMIKNGTNPFFVKELETGYVVIGDNQHFKGYTLFLCKEHKTELFHLDHTYKMKFLEEMSLVAEAVSKAFGAEKMNYELLGNGETHLHWHLFPRVNGDIENYGNNGKGPVWWYPMEKMYCDDNRPTETELEEMKNKLREELENCLNKF